jgi:TPR repeat protein
MYLIGEGVHQDKSQAVYFFTKACDGKLSDGCTNLGLVYSNSGDVSKDKFKAVMFFNKACNLKSELGCKKYALLKTQDT